ncbi:MAG: hypothetical protein ISN64_00285 [Rickettsia sp.]|nr:hypothetical protein [Rickettsia sp.]
MYKVKWFIFIVTTLVVFYFVMHLQRYKISQEDAIIFEHYVNALLNVPHSRIGPKFWIDSHPDLKPISEEEWLSFLNKKNLEKIKESALNSENHLNYEGINKEKIPYVKAFKINSESIMKQSTQDKNSIVDYICPNYYQCKARKLILTNYSVEDSSKLIFNLKKILEQPSKFIKKNR